MMMWAMTTVEVDILGFFFTYVLPVVLTTSPAYALLHCIVTYSTRLLNLTKKKVHFFKKVEEWMPSVAFFAYIRGLGIGDSGLILHRWFMRRDADHTFDLKGTIELDTVTVKRLSAH